VTLRALVTAVVAVLAVALIVGAALYVRRAPTGSENGIGGERPDGAASKPVVEVEQFSPEHLEAGRPAWKVKLSHLAVETGGQTITAGRMREGLIYDRQGRPAVRVTADTVRYDTASYNFDVEGNVRIVSPKGAVITTHKVHWDNKSRTLSAPGQVMLRTQDKITVITAGLRLDTPTQTVYCPNQVRMQTDRSDAVGRNLEYKLETGAFTLRSIQMVIDTQEAQERTG
jgi:lipopolysaccharide assembly outer membrane protein LptD (OstA)